MFRTDPGPNRQRLGFQAAVLSSFDFLTSRFVYRLVQSEPTFLRYEGDHVFINVFHGRGSYEVGCEIGLLFSSSGERFTLGEILEANGLPDAPGKTRFQASSPEGVASVVPKVADLVQRYAGPLLVGDPKAFQHLRERHTRWFESFMRDQRNTPVRDEASVAWQARDYARVVELYESISRDLTPLEVRRLGYARRKLSGT